MQNLPTSNFLTHSSGSGPDFPLEDVSGYEYSSSFFPTRPNYNHHHRLRVVKLICVFISCSVLLLVGVIITSNYGMLPGVCYFTLFTLIIAAYCASYCQEYFAKNLPDGEENQAVADYEASVVK